MCLAGGTYMVDLHICLSLLRSSLSRAHLVCHRSRQLTSTKTCNWLYQSGAGFRLTFAGLDFAVSFTLLARMKTLELSGYKWDQLKSNLSRIRSGSDRIGKVVRFDWALCLLHFPFRCPKLHHRAPSEPRKARRARRRSARLTSGA